MSKLHNELQTLMSGKFSGRYRIDVSVYNLDGDRISSHPVIVTRKAFNELMRRIESETNVQLNSPLDASAKEQCLSIVLDMLEDYSVMSALRTYGPYTLDSIHNDGDQHVLQITLTSMT